MSILLWSSTKALDKWPTATVVRGSLSWTVGAAIKWTDRHPCKHGKEWLPSMVVYLKWVKLANPAITQLA